MDREKRGQFLREICLFVPEFPKAISQFSLGVKFGSDVLFTEYSILHDCLCQSYIFEERPGVFTIYMLLQKRKREPL